MNRTGITRAYFQGYRQGYRAWKADDPQKLLSHVLNMMHDFSDDYHHDPVPKPDEVRLFFRTVSNLLTRWQNQLAPFIRAQAIQMGLYNKYEWGMTQLKGVLTGLSNVEKVVKWDNDDIAYFITDLEDMLYSLANPVKQIMARIPRRAIRAQDEYPSDWSKERILNHKLNKKMDALGIDVFMPHPNKNGYLQDIIKMYQRLPATQKEIFQKIQRGNPVLLDHPNGKQLEVWYQMGHFDFRPVGQQRWQGTATHGIWGVLEWLTLVKPRLATRRTET